MSLLAAYRYRILIILRNPKHLRNPNHFPGKKAVRGAGGARHAPQSTVSPAKVTRGAGIHPQLPSWDLGVITGKVCSKVLKVTVFNASRSQITENKSTSSGFHPPDPPLRASLHLGTGCVVLRLTRDPPLPAAHPHG